MIVYFADRNLNILGTASTDLPSGIVILDDEKTENIESGARTFNATFSYDDATRDVVTQNVSVGNFLLRSSDGENEFYTIIMTEHNTQDQTVQVYCEDAGLDLLNTNADELVNDTAHNCAWYVNKYLPAGWSIGINELKGSTLALSWDSDSTVTERLLSIASKFDGELDYSYEIDGLNVVGRHVNLYKSRGSNIVSHQLRLGYDISRITTNKSIENLATAYIATGGTLEGKKKPINLSGCDYSSDGKNMHSPANPDDPYQIVGKQVRCIPAMKKWSSKLDTDGKIVKEFSYDTKNKQTLFKKAVSALKKVINEETTYDIEFISFPEDARIGDWVNVVDDRDSLYLKGRILALSKSVTKCETNATLGEWTVKGSGISERLEQLAKDIRQQALSATTVTVSSSAGLIFNNTAISTTLTATVYYGDEAITTQTRLEEVFGTDVAVKWYHNGSLVGTGFTYTVSSANPNETYIVKVED